MNKLKEWLAKNRKRLYKIMKLFNIFTFGGVGIELFIPPEAFERVFSMQQKAELTLIALVAYASMVALYMCFDMDFNGEG